MIGCPHVMATPLSAAGPPPTSVRLRFGGLECNNVTAYTGPGWRRKRFCAAGPEWRRDRAGGKTSQEDLSMGTWTLLVGPSLVAGLALAATAGNSSAQQHRQADAHEH